MQPYKHNPTYNYSHISGREDCIKECLKRETGLDDQAIEEIVVCLGRYGLDFWKLAGCVGVTLLRRIWRALVKCWNECSFYQYSPEFVPGACVYLTKDGIYHCYDGRNEGYCSQISASPDVVWAEFFPFRKCSEIKLPNQ